MRADRQWVVWVAAALLAAVVMPLRTAAAAPPGPAGSGGVRLSLYTESYQGAFHLLVPHGWKAEGGMIPSGVPWNVVDLIESNIRFRVSSPDGKSFFGWYPRFYFQDPAVFVNSSGGILRPQPGQVLNGCWVFPFLDVPQYVQHIVFGQLSANEFESPRIIGAPVRAAELAPWVPQAASRSEYGYVNFESRIGGTPCLGRIYSINYDLGGMIWSTVGTFGLVAPASRWSEEERVMELCIRSFRLNPQWVHRAAAAARRRGEQYHAVIAEMNRIDQEIQRQRSQTRSDIQEEVYKVLTGQIETYDPQSGRMKYLPMYNHAWTDGRGNYLLRDDDPGALPVENPTEWRKLHIVNRNDPNYRPAQ